MHGTDALAAPQPVADAPPTGSASLQADVQAQQTIRHLQPTHLNPLQRDLLAKMEIEAGMVSAPNDRSLRNSYFDLIARFSALRTGLSHALLPELGHPLYFRCGSSDVANLTQIFRDQAQAFPMRTTPMRILDLGAYAGYAAVALARRFPQADILCVEPSPDSFRILTLNTTPYRRIERLQMAAWHHPARLGVAARYYGDWGTQLRDDGPQDGRTIPAQDIPGLLRHAGWNRADLVKCDIEGAEAAVFADPHAGWLHALDALAIETHDSIQPGSAAIVDACFAAEVFDRTEHGETTLYERKVPFRALLHPLPRTQRLIHAEPGLFPLALQDVAPAPWGFFTFDGTSCQLHPNPPGAPPARAVFPRTLDGQTRFRATLLHAGTQACDIRFALRIEREDGTPVAQAERTLAPGASTRIETRLPDPPATEPPWQGLYGRHRIVLETGMADGATHNHNAWARWIDPLLM